MSAGFATCERTGKSIPLSAGAFVATTSTGDWEFIAIDAYVDDEGYAIPVAKLTKSPEEFVDLIALLSTKEWFNATKFFELFRKLRSELSKQD